MMRRIVKGRLAYVGQEATAEFWDHHWEGRFDPAIHAAAEQGRIVRFYDEAFERWLPRHGRIVEVGCGLGQHVLALRTRGYDAEGIDTAAATVALVHRHRPDLPVRLGDGLKMEVPDGCYAGYIALGVVEHREQGPEPLLAEAHRVLAPGGIAILTVPRFNRLRRWKARMGFYRDDDSGTFYQYAFTCREFSALVRAAGFEIVDQWGFDPVKGLSDEVPLLKRLLGLRFVGWRLRRWLERRFRLRTAWGEAAAHMSLVVARKPAPCMRVWQTVASVH